MPAAPLIPCDDGGSAGNDGGCCDGATRKITWAEISKHNSLTDCWVVVQGKVYDVTEWVPQHPGGDIIGLGAGRDATALVFSYHPSHVPDSFIYKYYIGDVENYSSYYTYDSEFYRTVKSRVNTFMKTHNMTRHTWKMYLKSVVICTAWLAMWYLAAVRGYFIAAILWGLLHGQIGINIMHDGNHGSYSTNKTVCKIACFMMDFLGASSLSWRYQHVVGHHPNPNTSQTDVPENQLGPVAFDPDAASGTPFVRLVPNHPHMWFHKYQHIYVWFILVFLGVKWPINDNKYFIRRKYNIIEFGAPNPGELASMIITRVLFAIYIIIIPYYCHGFYGLFLSFICLSAMGYELELMFGVSHITEGNTFPDENTTKDERDWAILQVVTANNYATESWLCTQVTGGVNYQIEHHLFPSVNQFHLPAIAPIVRQTCKEYGVLYKSYPTYSEALYMHYLHFKTMGKPPHEATKKSQ